MENAIDGLRLSLVCKTVLYCPLLAKAGTPEGKGHDYSTLSDVVTVFIQYNIVVFTYYMTTYLSVNFCI